jgi:hypothetical protein
VQSGWIAATLARVVSRWRMSGDRGQTMADG